MRNGITQKGITQKGIKPKGITKKALDRKALCRQKVPLQKLYEIQDLLFLLLSCKITAYSKWFFSETFCLSFLLLPLSSLMTHFLQRNLIYLINKNGCRGAKWHGTKMHGQVNTSRNKEIS